MWYLFYYTINQNVQKSCENLHKLVVVVYLKFGDFGKEAAPLAGEIVNKWRSIKKSSSILKK